MSFLVAAVTLILCFIGTAEGQADTSRQRPLPRAPLGVRMSDSDRTPDIDKVEVLRSPAALGDPMGSDMRRRMLGTLEAQRRFWNERRPRTYLIRMLVVNECIYVSTKPQLNGGRLRERLIVDDTTIVRRELAPFPERYAQYCPRAWRIDDVFADVARALTDTTASITDVQYDGAYGFPRAYWVWRGISRGERVIVESFAPTP